MDAWFLCNPSRRKHEDGGRGMSDFVNPLPGVPHVESPFRERLLQDADAETQRIARDLDTNGFAAVDFPEPDFERISEAIKRELHGRYDWAEWHKSGHAQGIGMRVQDAWTFNENVKKIAVNARMLELLSKLYGRRAWPFQTLNFPVGTQQPFHTDTIHFSSIPERYMCGVWVAFEDVHEDSGPLIYYPGSHRWPIYANEHIGVCVAELNRLVGQELYQDVWRARVEQAGIRPHYFFPKKGQALIWAANLLHGGSPQRSPDQTRWSQVTHYLFDDCAYYTPMHSDLVYGNICFRQPLDISTGKAVPNMYAGHPIPRRFVQSKTARAKVALKEYLWSWRSLIARLRR